MAWVESDPEVNLAVIEVPSDGFIFLAAKATDLGEGTWNYEYAIQNLDSNRAVRSFSMPMVPSANLTNVGFHDVDYHSGEPFDGTDWQATVDDSTVTARLIWRTQTYFENPDANALRWGTLYNFRFDAPMPPTTGEVELGLFLPGVLSKVQAETIVPVLCNSDGSCDAGEDVCFCVADCEPAVEEAICTDGLDDDCDGALDCYDVDCCETGSECDAFDPDEDGFSVCEDCEEDRPRVWSTPGEVRDVEWQEVMPGQIGLAWTEPEESGTLNALTYDVIRSTDADDFMTDPTCLDGDPTQTWILDPEIPEQGSMFCYLVRAVNKCPGDLGLGDVGTGSSDPRLTPGCN